MGGYGSGRWGVGGKADARPLVESCWVLDVDRLAREGAIRAGARASGEWAWFRGETRVASVGYEAKAGAEAGTLRLRYTAGRGDESRPRAYPVPLVSTPLPSGGRRWWFLCTASRAGGPLCNRRVGKLYLAPGGSVFACRHCYGLAYTSSRESRKHDALYRRLAELSGVDPVAVKRAMGH